jgi:predicted metal-dependent peptidase
MSQAIKKLVQARTALSFDLPFFASLALRINLEEGKVEAPTVDGEKLVVPEGQPLSDTLARELIARAALHCGLGHPYRRGSRDRRKWSYACKAVVDIILAENGFLVPSWKQYQGLTAEQVFDRLPDEAKNTTGTGDDPPVDVEDGEGGENGEEAMAWKGATLAAAQLAEDMKASDLSASIQRMLDQARQPSIRWREILRDYITPTNGRDYTWSKPSRRFIASGVYLPNITVTQPGPIRVLIDASGSVSDVELSTFMAEVRSVQEEMAPESIEVVSFDTEIKRTKTFGAEEPVNFQSVKAGGGTSYKLLWPKGLADRQVDVVVTDGHCDKFPTDRPTVPVLWIVSGTNVNQTFKAPFGHVVILPEIR